MPRLDAQVEGETDPPESWSPRPASDPPQTHSPLRTGTVLQNLDKMPEPPLPTSSVNCRQMERAGPMSRTRRRRRAFSSSPSSSPRSRWKHRIESRHPETLVSRELWHVRRRYHPRGELGFPRRPTASSSKPRPGGGTQENPQTRRMREQRLAPLSDLRRLFGQLSSAEEGGLSREISVVTS